MFYLTKEFSTLKDIMEKNSEYIRIKEGVRVKAIDCKVFSIMITDLMRYYNILKIEDENYIFIRRAKKTK